MEKDPFEALSRPYILTYSLVNVHKLLAQRCVLPSADKVDVGYGELVEHDRILQRTSVPAPQAHKPLRTSIFVDDGLTPRGTPSSPERYRTCSGSRLWPSCLLCPRLRIPQSSKIASSSKSANDEAGALLTDSSGDKYINLGKKRRATVREFKGERPGYDAVPFILTGTCCSGSVYLDIREFYEADGETRPGKKGISISAEQVRQCFRYGLRLSDLLHSGKS